MDKVRAQLEEELKKLERELRVELPREIKTAVAMGDLRENAEYHAALERQRFVKARIGQLRERLAELSTLDGRVPRDRSGIGSVITVLDLETGEQQRYELVFPELADQARGMISVASPIGRGLVGRRAGEEVRIRVPSGERRYRIVELRTLHDLQDPGAGPSRPEA